MESAANHVEDAWGIDKGVQPAPPALCTPHSSWIFRMRRQKILRFLVKDGNRVWNGLGAVS